MPSRTEIRELAVMILYSRDLEESDADKEPHLDPWHLVVDNDRRELNVEIYRNVRHIVLDYRRPAPLSKFKKNADIACSLLDCQPEGASLKRLLLSIENLEEKWTKAYLALESIPIDNDDITVAHDLEIVLSELFRVDHDLWTLRSEFLNYTIPNNQIRSIFEPVASAVSKLQRVSEKMRVLSDPSDDTSAHSTTLIRRIRKRIALKIEKTESLVNEVIKVRSEIDRIIRCTVDNFEESRLGKVDRQILRLATYEIMSGTPAAIAINEAVELAKRFGTSDSSRFVNGVLDRIARDAGGMSKI